MLLWAGEAAQASTLIEGALRLDPTDARAAVLLGMADYFLDRYNKAVEAMNRGLARNLERTTQLIGRPVLAAT
jgi:cytochrome c-type biogenesis protein CcmH/NrfG